MTNYQEELTQMQHDLETALETMAEVLANTGGDTTGKTYRKNNFQDPILGFRTRWVLTEPYY